MHYLRDTCRGCLSKKVVPFLDLGTMPLAGGFLTSEQVRAEKAYPLKIYFCRDCALVQVLDVVDAQTLFTNYFYLSSVTKTLSGHFSDYAVYLKKRFLNGKDALAVEFGCNDGVLLKPLADLGVKTVGIEPSKNVSKIAREKGLEIVNDFFVPRVALEIVKKHGHADAILANNVFAHIDDLDSVVEGVTKLLKPDGVFAFEVHYLSDLIDGLQYDFFYHEHLCYYSLHAIEALLGRFDLRVFDAQRISIHSGSIRVMACKKESKRPEEKSVAQLLKLEKEKGLDKLATFTAFAKRVENHRDELRNLVLSFTSRGKRVAGYGASGRANTLLNYCNLDDKSIAYIVDDSPLRQNHLTPGTHIPVVPAEELLKNRPDCLLVLAWSYLPEIMARQAEFKKSGGVFLVPFPKPGVVK